MFCKQVYLGCPGADTHGLWLPRPSLGQILPPSPPPRQICPELSIIELKPDLWYQHPAGAAPSPGTYPALWGGLVFTALRPSTGSLGGRGLTGLLLEGEQRGLHARSGFQHTPGCSSLGVPLSPADPAGQRCSCMWYWEHWSHWDCRSDARHRLLCVLQQGMRDLFHPQHHPLSSAGRSPQPFSPDPARCCCRSQGSVREATNHLFCRKTMCTSPTCLGGAERGLVL